MKFVDASAARKLIAHVAALLLVVASHSSAPLSNARAQSKPTAKLTTTRRTPRPRTTPAKTVSLSKSNVAPSQTTQPVRVPQLPSAQSTQPAPQATPRPSPAPTQTPTPKPADAIDEDEVYTVTSNLVVVPVSVTNERGEPALGLKATDFHLEEEGRAQEIAQVGDAEQVPLDIAILFDVSSSVSQKSFFEFQQRAAASFLREVLKPTDRAAVVTITREPRLVQSLTSAEVATAKLTSIPAASAAEPTAFYDTVSYAAKYLAENAPGRHRRVIIAISDGDDNFSNAVREQTVAEYEAEQKAEAANADPKSVRAAARRDLQARHARAVAAVEREVQRADVVFYSINPGGPSVRLNEIASRAQNNMAQVADSTGGTAYIPARAEELETIFKQIASELRAQYLLQYYSNSNAPTGKFLSIKVQVPAQPALKVRARRGYYAKKG
jgi:Ca-activated chloride channel family protein